MLSANIIIVPLTRPRILFARCLIADRAESVLVFPDRFLWLACGRPISHVPSRDGTRRQWRLALRGPFEDTILSADRQDRPSLPISDALPDPRVRPQLKMPPAGATVLAADVAGKFPWAFGNTSPAAALAPLATPEYSMPVGSSATEVLEE